MYSQIFRKKNKKKYEEAKYYPYIIFMLLYREEEKKITELQNIWEKIENRLHYFMRRNVKLVIGFW